MKTLTHNGAVALSRLLRQLPEWVLVAVLLTVLALRIYAKAH